MSNFKTIRQTASMGILNEHRLRIMVSQGTCPGIYVGNRFLVNIELLIEKLQRESVKGEKENEQTTN